jgi:hypothetical protein
MWAIEIDRFPAFVRFSFVLAIDCSPLLFFLLFSPRSLFPELQSFFSSAEQRVHEKGLFWGQTC